MIQSAILVFLAYHFAIWMVRAAAIILLLTYFTQNVPAAVVENTFELFGSGWLFMEGLNLTAKLFIKMMCGDTEKIDPSIPQELRAAKFHDAELTFKKYIDKNYDGKSFSDRFKKFEAAGII